MKRHEMIIAGILIIAVCIVGIHVLPKIHKTIKESNRRDRENTERVINEIKSKGLKHYVNKVWEGTGETEKKPFEYLKDSGGK